MRGQEPAAIGKIADNSILLPEHVLRETIPVFVSSFNQPTYLENIVRWFDRFGFKNVTVLDQNSTSPRLLEVYKDLEAAGLCRVHMLERNLGPRLAVSMLLRSGLDFFVFTDPDLELPSPPAPDFLTRLLSLAKKYRVNKAGLALDISESSSFRDVQTMVGNLGTFGIVEWEQRFWDEQLEPGVYRADVDTTFFLWTGARLNFRRVRRELFGRRYVSKILGGFNRNYWIDIRVSGLGYSAKHLPWYVDDMMPEAERDYYRKTAQGHSTWVSRSKASGTEGIARGR